MIMTQILVPFFTISHTAISIFKYISSGYNNDAFEQMYPAKWVSFQWFRLCFERNQFEVTDFLSIFQLIYIRRYPFDWRKPTSFLVCAGIQAATVFARGQLIICTLSLVAGFSLFMSDFVSDLEVVLHDINEDLVAKKTNEQVSKRIQTVEKFIGFIQFDSQAKGLSSFTQFVKWILL